MQLIKDAALRAQNLLALALGKDSSYADYDYIINFIAIRNDDINLRFQSLGLNFDTQVVVLLNVPANTTDLSSYQAAGGALQNLFMIDSSDGTSPLEWRVAGGSDLDWQAVPMVGKVIDTNTATPGNPVASMSATVDSFEWRGGIVYISPCSQIVDLRIRGDFVPALTDDDASPFIKGMLNVLVYWTCETISKYGPGQESNAYLGFKDDASRAEGDFLPILAKAQHSMPTRLGGRRTQIPGPIGLGAFTPPIVG